MTKIYFALLLLLTTTLYGQEIICKGIYPSSIDIKYDFTYSIPGTSSTSWHSPDMSKPNNYVLDTLVLVNDGTPGTSTYGHPKSLEGCNNSSVDAYKGKIAVLKRYDCEFGTKAYKAQSAGAVAVIVVNYADSLIAMNGGTDGNKVTIPVIFLKSSQGDSLITKLSNNDTLVMYIGNKTKFYANDLTIKQGEASFAKYSAIPNYMIKTASEYPILMNGKIRNSGSNDLTKIKLSAKITHNNITLFSQSIDTFNIKSADSSDFDFGQFVPTNYEIGKYTLTYTIECDSLDQDTTDNQLIYNFYITDSLLAYAAIDTTKILPKTNTSVPNTQTVYAKHQACIHVKETNGSRMAVEGLYFSLNTNTKNPVKLDNQEINVTIYSWDDQFTNINDSKFGMKSLSELYNDFYYYSGETKDSMVYYQFSTNLPLTDNSRYLFCISPSVPKVTIGFNYSYNYDMNLNNYLEAISPEYINDGSTSKWYSLGYGTEVVPSIGLKTFDAANLGVKQINQNEYKLYPNPTQNNLTIQSTQNGSATIKVTDLTGKTVATFSNEFLNGKCSINLEQLSKGIYMVEIEQNNSITKAKITKD